MSATPLLPATAQVYRMPRHSNKWSFIRLVLPASVIATFLLFVFTLSILDKTSHPLPWKQPDVVFPDFSSYNKFIQKLPRSHFPIHPDDSRRIVAVGDIHGMNQSLSELLEKISYDPKSDTLIHLGDIVPKNKKVPLDPVLSFLSTNKVLGVRGNNDQTVIEWKSWMDWIISLPGGKEWLEDINALWSHIDGDESNAEFNAWLKKSHRKWQAYVPDDWKLLGRHYKVARDMSRAHYNYLCSLPLVLYAPTAHTYFVHAGLLPADPTRKLDDPKQPLSHWPTAADPEADDSVIRVLQEVGLLNEIPQNQDPWAVMNMRSLTKSGEVKDKLKKGRSPWTELWNDVMSSCSGRLMEPSKHGLTTRGSLPCFPSMVIYGHAAALGLDVNRWSIGLDTGCTYGHRLTAVVLDTESLFSKLRSETIDTLRDSYIPYGDDGTAQIISVKCYK